MRVCIHRGTHEIGGTCIEIEAQGKRLLLDLGLPLEGDPSEVSLPPVAGLVEPDLTLVGVCISHPHVDHYGLLPPLPSETPVLIGKEALAIINAASLFVSGSPRFTRTITLQDRTTIPLDPFLLTPYLVDHSAYDAYAVLVEAEGQRLFYSGDFRGHGRKARLLDRLVSHPPKDIDVLLIEGSTLGRSGAEGQYPSEADLEKQFLKICRDTKGMVLVWCSAQNIDRLVTIYRACRHSGRQFLVDMYTASVLRAIQNPRLPKAEWKGVRVYLPWTQKQKIIKEQQFELAKSFAAARIYPEDLKNEAGRSVMLFRPSMKRDLEKADCLVDATLIYSLWPGYLKQGRYNEFVEWLDKNSIPLVHCHTSGHAPLSDLKRLADALDPRILVPVHTFEPGRFLGQFKDVELKQDGQWWGLSGKFFQPSNMDKSRS